ncbi:hypothetical protein, partial [Listeria monocytogenes]|uniref:hypothetical protein n=1 Tax=Listeria monocytogenes TaxID=1639 RepID=UPI003AB52D93
SILARLLFLPFASRPTSIKTVLTQLLKAFSSYIKEIYFLSGFILFSFSQRSMLFNEERF